MRTQFPPFDQIDLGVGAHGDVQVVGRSGNQLYLAAWQASSTGKWMIPSYNVLASAAKVGSFALAKGNGGNLQAIGLENKKIFLSAWQDNLAGSWHRGGPLGDNPLFDWTTIALSAGRDNDLYVMGLGLNKQIYRGPWQSHVTGGWNQSILSVNPGEFQWGKIAPFKDNDNNLGIVGLGLDQEIYNGPHQDGSPTEWDRQADSFKTGRRWLDVLVAPSNKHPFLGLDAEHRIWEVALGNPSQTKPIDPNGSWWATIRVDTGYRGNVYIVGLGSDNRLYAGPWMEGDSEWRAQAIPLGPTLWRDIALGKDATSQNLQVLGVRRDDGKLFIAAWQDGSGEWQPVPNQVTDRSLSQSDDHGRWANIHLENVAAAFNDVPSEYTAEIVYDCKALSIPNPSAFAQAHFQGMARYENYYLLTHSTAESTGGPGQLFLLDRVHEKEVMRFNLPEPTRPHPGGCQVVGDYLAVELEPYSDESKNPPILRFYWLGSMSNNREPTLLPAAIMIPGFLGGAGAIAITSTGAPPNGYVIGLRTGNGATFFQVTNYLLDDPDLQLGEPIEIKTDFYVESAGEKHGPDNMNLFTDTRGNLFLLALGGQGILEDSIAWDWADLYQVHLKDKKLQLLSSKKIDTSAFLHGFQGVHFRYGAGALILNSSQMMLYGCARNILNPGIHNYKLWTNEFQKS